MKYQIEITEIVEVEAESLSDAIMKVAQDYSAGRMFPCCEGVKGYKIVEHKE